jgi:hypothetical protein
VRKCFTEDLTRQVFRVGVVGGPPDDVGPDAMEVAILDFDEPRRVSLHRFG